MDIRCMDISLKSVMSVMEKQSFSVLLLGLCYFLGICQ